MPPTVEQVKRWNYEYHTLGQPSVSDEVYDAAKKSLGLTDSDLIGSVPLRDKIKLPIFMGSLDKVSSTREVNNFTKRIPGPYVLSDKLDGISALLWRDDKGLKLFTRGDGFVGQDVTRILPHISNIPDVFRQDRPSFAIRGELIIPRSSDIGNLQARRNAVTGLVVTAKNPDIRKLNKIDFLPYAVIEPSGMSQSQQLAWLAEQGWPNTVWAVQHQKLGDMDALLSNRMSNSPYEIDGIVIMQDIPHEEEHTGKNVDYAVAYKNRALNEAAEVEVARVDWNMSKDGLLKPTAVFSEPVVLNSSKIARATAHNAKNVIEKGIGPGARLRIMRSGNVIPYIKEVLQPARNCALPEGTTWKGCDLVYQDTGAGREDLKRAQLRNFFKIFKVNKLADRGVDKLYENQYTEPFDVLLKLDHPSAQRIFGKIGKDIVDDLQNKDLDFVTLVLGYNIFEAGVSNQRLRVLQDKFPQIFDPFEKDTVPEIEELNSLPSFGTKISADIHQGCRNLVEFKKKYVKELEQLYRG